MLFPTYKYFGLKSELKSVTPITEGPISLENHEGELYASAYRFDEQILVYSSLANLDDNVRYYSDYLVFDFDSHESLEYPLADANDLCKALDGMGAKYETYFSGLKGFHVCVPTCQFGFEPCTDIGILKRLAELIGSRFRTFDSSIYNKTRVLRVANTAHRTSGLYKIPLKNLNELSTTDILALAKEPADWAYPPAYSYPKVDLLCRLYERCKPKINRAIQSVDPKESRYDTGIIKQAEIGKRNETLYTMARNLAKRGIQERDALLIGNWWNRDLVPPMDSSEVATTVKSAYKKGVNQLIEDNLFNFAFNSKKALAQVRTVYQNWGESVVQCGYPFLDEYTLGFFKQETIFIISRTRNFKTCLLSNLLHGTAKLTNRPCIFFSQEMSVESLTARHIQKSERLTQREVLDRLKAGEDFQLFESDFKNVFVVGLSSLNTDKVLQIIDKFLEEYGSLGAIGFDYLSLFEGCANDTARTARMATELKTRIAKAANCPTFCLVQAKREYDGNEGDLEIDLTAGKDSSSIEDSGDYVIGTWGHWVKIPTLDPITGDQVGTKLVKKLYGRFLKARKFLSEKYPDLPYFEIDIEKEFMNVKAITFTPVPPKFRQKEFSQKE